jgi:hypothetical protein
MGFFSSFFKGILSLAVGVFVAVAAFYTFGATLLVAIAVGVVAAAITYSALSYEVSAGDSARNDGATLNKAGTNLHIPIIYGERTVGGVRAYVSTAGDENKYLYVALSVCEGEIGHFGSIYIDDELAWEGSTSHGATYTTGFKGKFVDHIQFQAFHGTETQTASSLLKETSGWSDSHQGKGVAYIAFRFKWFKIESNDDADDTPWNGGIPSVKVVVSGKKIADASTFADTSTRSTTYANESTVYNTNNVNVLLDYLRNPIYGKGLSNESMHFKTFKDEAIRFNLLDDGTTAPSDLTQTCDAVIFTDKTVLSNVKTILQNMRSALPFIQGKYKCSLEDNRSTTSRYGSTSTSVMTIDEDKIIGKVEVQAEDVKSKFNSIVVTYRGGEFNQAEDLQVPTAGSADESTYLSEDNNRLNEQKINLDHVTSESVAQKYAEITLARSRYRSKTLTFMGDASLNELEINDVFTMQYDSLGINGTFRVRQINFNSNYTFNVIADEHNDNTYAGNPNVFVARSVQVGRVGEGVPTTFTKTSTGLDIGTFKDVVTDVGGDDDDALQAIASGTYTYNTAYDVIYPSVGYAPIPNLSSILIQPSTAGTSGERDLILTYDAITAPNVTHMSLHIYDESNNVWTNLPVVSTSPERGKLGVVKTSISVGKTYGLKSNTASTTSQLSNTISITTSDLYSNATVTQEY